MNFLNLIALLVVCIPPVAPQNGSITPTNQTLWIENDIVTFDCDIGFRFVGDESTITCSNPHSFVEKVYCKGKYKNKPNTVKYFEWFKKVSPKNFFELLSVWKGFEPDFDFCCKYVEIL